MKLVRVSRAIKCSECEHCVGYQRGYATRKHFFCEMPNSADYINGYFKEHRIQKMEGFIGFSKPYESKPQIKTSPAWCPKKGGVADETD